MHTKISETTFAGQPIYVGIDVHLKSWIKKIDTEMQTFVLLIEALFL